MSPPACLISSMSSRRRTRLMVRKPRFFAIAINERPTPEFAPFWTIQSPGLRLVYSLKISAAVGGLLASCASCNRSPLGSGNSAFAGASRRSLHVRLKFGARARNMKGEKMLDKMSARCAALSVASGDKKYIDGACVLTDSDGDQIFSTFDTRDTDKSQPQMNCGTHIITGGTGKYKGITGKRAICLHNDACAGWPRRLYCD